MKTTIRAPGEDANGMLWGLGFDEGRASDLHAPKLEPAAGSWSWAHFRLADVRARQFLEGLDLPADALELIESREARIQLHHDGDWVFGVLPDLERELSGCAVDVGRLRFAMDRRRLITARGRPLLVIEDIRRQALAGLTLAEPVDALEAIVEHYLDVMEHRSQQLSDQLDAIEDHVLAGEGPMDLVQLGPIRRELSNHKREFVSLRGTVTRAVSERQGRRVSLLAKPLSELASVIEDLDREAAGLQERARLLHEEIDTRINSQTNLNMRALAVVSTLLLPSTIVVGAFGMNVKGVPWSDHDQGFWWAGALCLITVLGGWWLLKRMKVL